MPGAKKNRPRPRDDDAEEREARIAEIITRARRVARAAPVKAALPARAAPVRRGHRKAK